MIGGKYNKWIVILQEFDLEFVSAKSKKSLIFAELISDFLSEAEESVCEDMFVDEHIFLILMVDPWYRDIIVYLQMQRTPTHLSWDERRRLRRFQELPHSGQYFVLPWSRFPFTTLFNS